MSALGHPLLPTVSRRARPPAGKGALPLCTPTRVPLDPVEGCGRQASWNSAASRHWKPNDSRIRSPRLRLVQHIEVDQGPSARATPGTRMNRVPDTNLKLGLGIRLHPPPSRDASEPGNSEPHSDVIRFILGELGDRHDPRHDGNRQPHRRATCRGPRGSAQVDIEELREHRIRAGIDLRLEIPQITVGIGRLRDASSGITPPIPVSGTSNGS